jgi:hypothetical protein
MIRNRVLVLFVILIATWTTFAGGKGTVGKQSGKRVEYVNARYGFRIALPEDWRGYSIVNDRWHGGPMVPGGKDRTGPMITIRHPLWTEANPYQDIPILTFTTEQWRHIEDLILSPAPVGPSKVGSNARFVFAVPPRYVGFNTEVVGWEEVMQWMQTDPLRGY